jgi:hypothetical protein
VLRLFVFLASIANCAGGLILITTYALMWQRVPIIVLFIGASLLIQGAYTILYLHGELDPWGGIATGALFAGEGLALCVGAGGLILGIIHNIDHADQEMAPVLAGFLMLLQALLTLSFLLFTDRLRPSVN